MASKLRCTSPNRCIDSQLSGATRLLAFRRLMNGASPCSAFRATLVYERTRSNAHARLSLAGAPAGHLNEVPASTTSIRRERTLYPRVRRKECSRENRLKSTHRSLRSRRPGAREGTARVAPAWHCREWMSDGLPVRPYRDSSAKSRSISVNERDGLGACSRVATLNTKLQLPARKGTVSALAHIRGWPERKLRRFC